MMYTIEGIILRKSRIDEHRVVVSCFSSEYGKIDIFGRETPSVPRLDTLTHFTGRIMTKEKNTLTQISSLRAFTPQGDYALYDLVGWGVSILYTLLPHGLPYPKLFALLKSMTLQKENSSSEWLLFLIQTCRDFGITKCDIREYADRLTDPLHHDHVRADIQGWIDTYRLS